MPRNQTEGPAEEMKRCPRCSIIARKRLFLQLQADISKVPSTELLPRSLLQRLNL